MLVAMREAQSPTVVQERAEIRFPYDFLESTALRALLLGACNMPGPGQGTSIWAPLPEEFRMGLGGTALGFHPVLP